MFARIVNFILGAWLFVSAFLWQHSASQFTNTWILGLLAAVFAFVALTVPQVRYLNTALAVWLFLSAFLLPRLNVGTLWNNVLVAIAIFVISLIPSEREARPWMRRPVRGTP